MSVFGYDAYKLDEDNERDTFQELLREGDREQGGTRGLEARQGGERLSAWNFATRVQGVERGGGGSDKGH